jgi:hypothetical protein
MNVLLGLLSDQDLPNLLSAHHSRPDRLVRALFLNDSQFLSIRTQAGDRQEGLEHGTTRR